MTDHDRARTPEVTVADLDAHLAGGGQVVDVREAHEYLAGHVPGAHLVPMGQLPARLAEVDRSGRVLVVCASGGRGAARTQFLRQVGVEAHSVAGGTAAWLESGRPVITGPHAGDLR